MVAVAKTAAAQKASDQQARPPGSYGIHRAPPSLKGSLAFTMILYRHSLADLFPDLGDCKAGKDAVEFRPRDRAHSREAVGHSLYAQAIWEGFRELQQ